MERVAVRAAWASSPCGLPLAVGRPPAGAQTQI